MNVYPFPVQSAQRKVAVAASTLSTLAALIVAAPDAHAQQPAPTDVGAATSHVSTVALQEAPPAVSAQPPSTGSGLTLSSMPPIAIAQPTSAAPVANPPRRPVIGAATANLLALQRESVGRARPVAGDQASLSYARYLKSFEFPIPEKYESNIKDVKQSGGGGS
ncbi:uncharacterized protein DUF3613 [Comamonas sp. BIGb0124]|uniref:DUF3613 domain-containing protein n=1 Tax=Comamonas sp. BIGb0124 TaxID=2485130 RepID=UPI000F4AEBE0|nr:DUF3613 domain-containing protein [Comamonas sp. BIGb0124]ROR21444.1 uncharacterized protein DUF3613 [Comamonas sp. BIGb0124]